MGYYLTNDEVEKDLERLRRERILQDVCKNCSYKNFYYKELFKKAKVTENERPYE